MMPEHTSRGDANLGNDAVEEMAKYGITCTQISQFFYGGYRYTNLADAIAEAKRHPRAGLAAMTSYGRQPFSTVRGKAHER